MALTRRQNCARNAPKAPAAAKKIGSSATNSGEIPSPQTLKRAPKATRAARRASKAREAKNTGSKLGKVTPPKRAPRARKTGNSASPTSTAISPREQRMMDRNARTLMSVSTREQRLIERARNRANPPALTTKQILRKHRKDFIALNEFHSFESEVNRVIIAASENPNDEQLRIMLYRLRYQLPPLRIPQIDGTRELVENEKRELAERIENAIVIADRHREERMNLELNEFYRNVFLMLVRDL